jgi:phosphopentomutase
MRRAFLLVLDGFGVGELPDAASYGDVGANTFVNGYRLACPQIPVLKDLGLETFLSGRCTGIVGRATKASVGKESLSGHWEMGRVSDVPYFDTRQGFSSTLISMVEDRIGMPVIGNRAFQTLVEGYRTFWDEHLRTKHPIVLTEASRESSNSFVLAASEMLWDPRDLALMCERLVPLLREWNVVARVAARPIRGHTPETLTTSPERKDHWLLDAPHDGLLVALRARGVERVSAGKPSVLFMGSGFERVYRCRHYVDVFEALNVESSTLTGFLWANINDLDEFGHRKDVAAWGSCLEQCDLRIGKFLPRLRADDLFIITSDHGNDPTLHDDHTREYVPILVYQKEIGAANLGVRTTIADVGATIEEWLLGNVSAGPGTSFLSELGLRP